MSSISSNINQQVPIIAEFFGIWGDNWDQKLRKDTPLDKLNRLYISFGKIIQDSNNQFTVAIDGDETRVVQLIDRMKVVNPNADIFLAVGGNGDSASYGGASNDSNFPQNVLNVLQKYGMQGFDIDWEENIIKNQLSKLTTGLYEEFHQKGFKVTLDGWSYPDNAYDMQVLKQSLTQINMMTYGVYSDLDSCVTAYEAEGFPKNQLIGGIETELNYNAGVDTLGQQGSIATKATYAKTNNLAGMMAWNLSNDYTTIECPNIPTYKGGIELWSVMMN